MKTTTITNKPTTNKPTTNKPTTNHQQTNNQQQQPVTTTMKGTDLSSLHCGSRLRHFGGGADGHGGCKQGGGSWTYCRFFSNLILLFGEFCDQIHDSPKKVSFQWPKFVNRKATLCATCVSPIHLYVLSIAWTHRLGRWRSGRIQCGSVAVQIELLPGSGGEGCLEQAWRCSRDSAPIRT